MTPLTVNRTRSKNSLLGQKEKKKRNSNLNLASLFLISSILFYLHHPLYHSTSYTLPETR